MNQLTYESIEARLLGLADSLGLAELAGGTEVLRAGLRDIRGAVAQVAVDLLVAEAAGVDLADAVHDRVHSPHLVRAHGLLFDVLVMRVPDEVVPWVRRALTVELPEIPETRRTVVRWALRGEDPATTALARWVLFEALCVNQRLMLMAEGVHLEAHGGRRADVEIIAQQEVEAALVLDEGGAPLLETEDHLETIVLCTFVQLERHVEELRVEFGAVADEVKDQLSKRAEILSYYERLEPEDAIILYNAAELGDEELAAEDLRQEHPALLGDLTDDAVYQRKNRLAGKVRKIAAEGVTLRSGKSFADLLLEQIHGGGE